MLTKQVSNALFWAGCLADLVAIQQANVVVALEVGSDLTTLVRAVCHSNLSSKSLPRRQP